MCGGGTSLHILCFARESLEVQDQVKFVQEAGETFNHCIDQDWIFDLCCYERTSLRKDVVKDRSSRGIPKE